MAKKGAPIGNHNAQGKHDGTSRLKAVGAGMLHPIVGPLVHGAVNSSRGNTVHSGSHALGGAVAGASLMYAGARIGGLDTEAAGALGIVGGAIHGGMAYGSSKVGKALGGGGNLRKANSQDTAKMNQIVAKAKSRQSTFARLVGIPAKVNDKEWAALQAIHKRSKIA